MIEISAPSGNLEDALIAFNNGADSVYFGLKEFSARKSAENFSLEDLSKIKERALRLNKKIYIAFNTLLDDSALERAYHLLNLINDYEIDGIIVQDLGLIRLLNSDFPSIPIHASTQMAVHTSEGVKALKRLNVKRAILSRELSLDEIKRIREENRDIELKCFIHGAMCYGTSGLCMASKIITGLSANEGECKQICRTYFFDEKSKRMLYPFSMKDLVAGEYVKELNKIGIDSLKIEGRMKGSEYVASTVRYYRHILDNTLSEDDYSKMASSFKRESSSGYLNYKKENDEKRVSTLFSSHIGECLGKIEVDGSKAAIPKTLYPYDTLAVLRETKNGLLEKKTFTVRPPIKHLGAYSLIDSPDFPLRDGENIYRVSMGSNRERKPSTNLPLYKAKRDIEAAITDNGISINGIYREAKIADSSNESSLEEIERTLLKTGTLPFRVRKIDLTNNSSFKYPSISKEQLKAIRDDIYNELSKTGKKQKEYEYKGLISKEEPLLPERSLLIGKDGLPWNEDGVIIDGYTYVTLSPVSFNDESHYDRVLSKLKGKANVKIGINNIDALYLYEKYPEFEYFADIYLYMSNREAAMLLLNEVPKALGTYLWAERGSFAPPWPLTPKTVSDVNIPLFISRSCYRSDTLKESCEGCTKDNTYYIKSNSKRYRVIARNCITYVLGDK